MHKIVSFVYVGTNSFEKDLSMLQNWGTACVQVFCFEKLVGARNALYENE